MRKQVVENMGGPMARKSSKVNKARIAKKRRETRAAQGRKPWRIAGIAFCLGTIITAVVLFASGLVGRPSAPASDADNRDPLRRLSVLLAAGPDGLADIDIAEMNLLCAAGLPGSERIDIERILAKLDGWAERVKSETGRNMHRFRESPGEYNNSEAYFRAMMLVTVLQQDLGVRYNPARIRDVDFNRAADLFIHGMIAGGEGGTCVSMPVLYAAIGRRLGYPLKLVLAKAHVFVRWDDGGGERFNIEATNQGMNSFDDEYYKTWPQKMTPAEIAAGVYLKSLNAAGELALFLATRGHCLLDNGRTSEAQIAYAWAHHLAPDDPQCLVYLADAVRRERPGIFQRGRGDVADQMAMGRTSSRGQGSMKKPDPLAELRRIEAINEHNRRMLHKRTALPPRSGAGTVRQPGQLHQPTLPQPPGIGVAGQPGVPR